MIGYLYKMQRIEIGELNKTFSNALNRHLCIDETIVHFTAVLIRQSIQGKRNKYGSKLYDSKKGYTFRFIVYARK